MWPRLARLLPCPPCHARQASSVALRARKGVPVPHAFRKPFQQPNKRRDDVFVERMLPAVPQTSTPLQAWLSSWDEPRIGITELRADVWGIPPRQDLVHNVVLWQVRWALCAIARWTSSVRGPRRFAAREPATGDCHV